MNIAIIYEGLREYDNALKYYNRAAEIYMRFLPMDNALVRQSQRGITRMSARI